MVTSEGGVSGAANPRHLSRALRKVRRLSRAVSRRQGPDRRAARKPSNRWHRADAARNKALGKVAGQRQDAVHKLTTGLAAEFGTVVIEDLHVAGMMKSRRLARHVADAAFGEVRRQLEYKIAWHGGKLIDYVIEVLARVAARAGSLPGMRIVSQPAQLRHFTAHFEPVT